jgi:predicted metal-binding membrane protein
VILFPLGLMNLAIMVQVTALIFAEKALPIGR